MDNPASCPCGEQRSQTEGRSFGSGPLGRYTVIVPMKLIVDQAPFCPEQPRENPTPKDIPHAQTLLPGGRAEPAGSVGQPVQGLVSLQLPHPEVPWAQRWVAEAYGGCGQTFPA